MGAVARTEARDGDKPGRVVSLNPATGEVLGEVPEQGVEEVLNRREGRPAGGRRCTPRSQSAATPASAPA